MKQAFSAYLHQVSGNNFLLREPIELPIVILNRGGSSEEEPSTGGREQIRGLCAKTTLARLIQEWKEHKKSDEYKESIQKAQKKAEAQRKRGIILRETQRRHQEGGRLVQELEEGRMEWEWLESYQQEMVNEYENGTTAFRWRQLLDEQLDGIKYYGGSQRLSVEKLNPTGF